MSSLLDKVKQKVQETKSGGQEVKVEIPDQTVLATNSSSGRF
jgi:hypothetical protein